MSLAQKQAELKLYTLPEKNCYNITNKQLHVQSQ